MYRNALENDLGIENIDLDKFWEAAAKLEQHKRQKRPFIEVLQARYYTRGHIKASYTKLAAHLYVATSRAHQLIAHALRRMRAVRESYTTMPHNEESE